MVGKGVEGSFPQLYISSSWVRIRLHIEIQLPRLLASTLFWWGYDCDPDRVCRLDIEEAAAQFR